MKQMTSNDYAKELHKMKLDQMALEKRIEVRAQELMKQNPDVLIQLPYFTTSYNACEIELTKDVDVYDTLKIIEQIEADIKHPHKKQEEEPLSLAEEIFLKE